MAVIFTDDFNRADGGVGGNYTTGGTSGGMSIVSNEAKITSAGEWGSFYSAGAVPDDQYAQAKIVYAGAGVDSGPFISVRQVTTTGYSLKCSVDYTRCERFSGATHTFLFGSATLIGANDIAYLEIVGTSMDIKKNGSSLATGSDGTHATGAFGIGSVGAGTLDDFEGGDFAAASTRKRIHAVT